jgi:6-phospho-beta-glucosidase
MVGLNHACWGVEQSYDGRDPMPLLAEAWERRRGDPTLEPVHRRQLQLAVAMGVIPADYFQYYYFTDDVLAEYRAKPTTRAEDILGWSTDYWRHYEEQARSDDPQLDPGRSRGGINELELAIDVMDAIFNDKDEVHPVNLPNVGGALPGFPEDLVVEVLGRCHAGGIDVLPSRPLPRHVRGLVEMLGEYQALAAETAWNGSRQDGIRALTANPLVRQMELAERLYDALATAHRDYLPDRLWAAA